MDLDVAADLWLLPDEPVSIRFVNTLWADRHGVHDALTEPAHLADWLAAVGLVDGKARVRAADLDHARRLRGALRTLAAFATGDERPIAASDALDEDVQAAVEELNRTAAASPPIAQIRRRDEVLEPWSTAAGTSVETALARVAIDATEVLGHGPDERLRACYGPGCVLYFVKQHARREWCSPACGNRARVARHYDRHRATR